jgi:hypothetical protein
MLVAGQIATAAPAAAAVPVSGLETVRAVTDFNFASTQATVALCPPGKVVIGGGGRAEEAGVPAHKLALTQLEPSATIPVPGGTRHGYRVSAAKTDPTFFFGWRVEAYALCAFPVSGLHIETEATTDASQTVQATLARCPSGQRVLGTGARINNHNARVGLQVARPSGPGDIARAQAREIRSGQNWNLVAFAVCAPPPSGYQVKFAESPERESEQVKTAVAVCDGSRRTLSAGAAVTNVAPGNIALEEAVPPWAGHPTTAQAVEVIPTSQNWDFMVATAICANATT